MEQVRAQSIEELRIRKIKNGTVIDHLPQHSSLIVLKILGITGKEGNIVSIAMNVPSQRLGKKDIVKVEDRELSAQEADKIALIAPRATINIIRDYEVVEKRRAKLLNLIKGFPRCANPTCISNSSEPVQYTFHVEREEPLRLRCHYCNYIMEKEDILQQF